MLWPKTPPGKSWWGSGFSCPHNSPLSPAQVLPCGLHKQVGVAGRFWPISPENQPSFSSPGLRKPQSGMSPGGPESCPR